MSGPVGGAGELTAAVSEVRDRLWEEARRGPEYGYLGNLGDTLNAALDAKAPHHRWPRIRHAAKAPQGVPACEYCEALWERDEKTMKHRHPSVAGFGAFAYKCAAAPPAPSKLPVPGPVSDTTIHHGMFPPAASVVAAKCVNCGQPIYDNGTVYIHRKVLNASTVLETQWCHGVDKGFIAETELSREAAAPSNLHENKNTCAWCDGSDPTVCQRCASSKCDHCGQDVSGPDFQPHRSVYCHKPECAEHLAVSSAPSPHARLDDVAYQVLKTIGFELLNDDPRDKDYGPRWKNVLAAELLEEIKQLKAERVAAASKPEDHGGKEYLQATGLASKPAVDNSRCSLCGAPRIALDRSETRFGACTFVDCKDPLYDFRVENPNAAIVNDSRSQQKRVAAMKGEPMPTFEPAPCELCGGTGKFKDASLADAPTQPCPCGPTPAPGAERLLKAGDEVWVRGKVTDSRPLSSGAIVVAMSDSSGDDDGVVFVRPEHVREALAAAPPAPTNDHELLVGGVVRAALELAILRGDLRMDNGDSWEEMSESEREDVISDTWNAMNGEGTCDDDQVKELKAIYAALADDRHASAERVRELERAIQRIKEEYEAYLDAPQTAPTDALIVAIGRANKLLPPAPEEEEPMPCERCQENAETVWVPTGFSGEREPLCGKCISLMLDEGHASAERVRRDAFEEAACAIERVAQGWADRIAQGLYQGETLRYADVRRDEGVDISRHIRKLGALPPSTGEKS